MAMSACGGATANGTVTQSGSPKAKIADSPEANTAPTGQQLSLPADKAAAAAVDKWLQLFNSTQSQTTTDTSDAPLPEEADTGATWQQTANLSVDGITKVGGRSMTGADIVGGAASSPTNFIKATIHFHDNNPHTRYRQADFTASIEVRQIVASVSTSAVLSAADQANGITYSGSVELTFISRCANPATGTPIPFADGRFGIGLTLQNGQAQVTLDNSYQPDPPVAGPFDPIDTTGKIRYPVRLPIGDFVNYTVCTNAP
jgi:hypothetical protein